MDFESVGSDLMIDLKAAESKHIKLPCSEVLLAIQERAVDDLRSFRHTIYNSIIVTAMELARLLYGDPYRESYRYSQNSTLNLMRGARWKVLPYAKTEAWTGKSSAQKPKMVIICIPPWDISKLDLQDFTTRRTVSI
jgi:hypothetical protein